jgi:uncharacterized protein
MADSRPLAVITGASSGIGLELAKQFAQNGFDVFLASDRDHAEARAACEAAGAEVRTMEVDLSTKDGVDQLWSELQSSDRPVEALAANAGVGLGHAFLDQTYEDWNKVVDTNIVGTLHLIQHVAKDMRSRGDGKILITGSIAGLMPGSFQAVYNGTKAFLDSFSFALRNEMKDTGVSITNLLPGATDTDFFDRAELGDTKVGQAKKDDPAMVAKTGFDALMKGEGDVVAGWKNKLQAAAAAVIPDSALAEMHRGMAEPGSGSR